MFSKLVESLKGVIESVGKVVDVVVPVGVGARTKVAVIACPVLGLAAPFLSLIPGSAPFVALIPAVQKAFCAAAPAFALAGLVRK